MLLLFFLLLFSPFFASFQHNIFASGANILISPSWLSPVHRFTMRELAAELVRRNHTVTWLEYGLRPHSIPLPAGVEELFLRVERAPRVSALLNGKGRVQLTSNEQLWREGFWQPVERPSGWLASLELCQAVLAEHKNAFEQLVQRRFAAVLVDDLYNPCALLHAGLQRSLFVYWSMTGLRTESAWANQSPSPPSYIPVPGTGLTDEMGFWARAYNLLAYLRQLYIHQHIILRRVDKLFQKHFPGRVSDAFSVERNASINFVNHPPIFDFARPFMPRVNFVGGLHCLNQSKKWANADKKLGQFVEGACEEKGFVLITGGFSIQWADAPPEVVDNLLGAIREMNDTHFVWQYDGPALRDAPSNLFIAEWLPQQQLLAHPKCRAHLSHGGLNSVIESVWHGVPLIGWPLTAEARDNVLRVTARYAGLTLEQKRPSKSQFLSALKRIYIRFYKQEMLVFQDMLIDVPYTELNHSAFWVEFIVRHQEVPHARSGADELNILQYFLVDVVLFLLTVAILAIWLLLQTLKFLTRGCFWAVRRLVKSGKENGGRKGGEKVAKEPTKKDAVSKKRD